MIPAFMLTPAFVQGAMKVSVILAFTGFIYYEGGKGPRADFTEYKTQEKIAAQVHEKQDAAAAKASKKTLDNLEKKHEEDLTASDAAWVAYIARLPKPTGSVAIPKPVLEPAKGCDGQNDDGLSLAVLKYRTVVADVLGSLEEETVRRRSGTSELLKVCTQQALSLREWREFGTTLRLINSLGASQ